MKAAWKQVILLVLYEDCIDYCNENIYYNPIQRRQSFSRAVFDSKLAIYVKANVSHTSEMKSTSIDSNKY